MQNMTKGDLSYGYLGFMGLLKNELGTPLLTNNQRRGKNRREDLRFYQALAIFRRMQTLPELSTTSSRGVRGGGEEKKKKKKHRGGFSSVFLNLKLRHRLDMSCRPSLSETTKN